MLVQDLAERILKAIETAKNLAHLDHSGAVDECPVCCPDFPTNLSSIPVNVPPPKNHYHHCPECYEVYECGWQCTMEPDLDDPICHPGKQFGGHCPCFQCQSQEHREKATYSSEWWERYNGTTRKS